MNSAVKGLSRTPATGPGQWRFPHCPRGDNGGARPAVAPAGVQGDKRMTQRFGYAVDRRYLPLLLPFRFKPDRDGVTLSDDTFEATFGFFRVATARDNITGAHITRNYRWWTAFGVRGSMADDGLSFGTNHDAGVCIHFAEKVPSRLS